MSITIVDVPFGGTQNNGNTNTLTFPAGMQQDDILVIFGGFSSRDIGTPGPVDPTGWTQQALHDPGTTTTDTDFGCWTFIQPSVPITSEDFSGSGHAQEASGYVGVCLRGADPADIVNVISAITAGTDPPAVTTTVDGALVIISAIDVSFTSYTAPTGYSNSITVDGVDTNRIHTFLATKEIITAGAEDPGDTSADETLAANCITIAINPVGGGGGGTTYHADQDNTVVITDSRATTQKKIRNETVNLSDTVAKQLAKNFFETLSITDEITVQKTKFLSFENILNTTDTIEFILTKEQIDPMNMTDVLQISQSKSKTDSVNITDRLEKTQKKTLLESIGITDTLSIIKTKFSSLSSLVGITDSISITLKKIINSVVGVSDTATISGGQPAEVTVSSLVDTARENYQSAFSITDADMSKLSINDVMHKYWSGDFPLGHAYDGSESTLTPAEDFSTMDHHSEVESNEATDLNWIKDIV